MLNDRLKKLRLSKGLTLQQVGDHFGISKSSVANWENGTNQPDLKKLEGLAEFFNTNVEYLITGRSNSFAENKDPQLHQVRFIPWEDLLKLKLSRHISTLPALYSTPTPEAFATRIIGSSALDWNVGPIPMGSIIFVEPNKSLSQGCLILAFDSSNELGIAQFINTDKKDHFIVHFYNKNITLTLENRKMILGVLLEWRLSGRL